MELRNEVIQWWHSGCDYQTGCMLFAQTNKNPQLAQFFMQKTARFQGEKLKYQLTKAVGLNWQKMPKPDKMPEKSKPTTKLESVPAREPENFIPETGRETEYPKIIRRLKYEYSDLYNRRSINHQRMGKVPAENAPRNMDRRAELFREIELITDRMEFLWGFIESWEKTGVEPIEEEIWPVKKEEELPDDPDELKRMKKNLQTSNTKDRNMLQYQQKSKGKRNNPMPPGPKRIRIELRIARRDQEIERIDTKLVKIERDAG